MSEPESAAETAFPNSGAGAELFMPDTALLGPFLTPGNAEITVHAPAAAPLYLTDAAHA